jgi:hypothetical protein
MLLPDPMGEALEATPGETSWKNGVRAFVNAARESWHGVRSWGRKYLVPELAFVAGVALLAMLIPSAVPDLGELPVLGKVPAAVDAALSAALALLAAGLVWFLGRLLWSPFIDHHQLVGERDYLLRELLIANLRYLAHDWENFTSSQDHALSRRRHVMRGTTMFDPEPFLEGLTSFVLTRQDQLRNIGQPELAERLESFKNREAQTEQDCEKIIQEFGMLIHSWSAGATIPKFVDPNRQWFRAPKFSP